jgi:hypothetical protein
MTETLLSKMTRELLIGTGAVLGITYLNGYPFGLTVLVLMFAAHIGNKIRRGGLR